MGALLAHDVDIGLVGVGPTKSEAFRQAALALTAVVTDLELVKPAQEIQLTCHAPTDELLLATARGEQVEPERHEPAVEIKGVTLTALRVTPVAGGWRVQCVVDV